MNNKKTIVLARYLLYFENSIIPTGFCIFLALLRQKICKFSINCMKEIKTIINAYQSTNHYKERLALATVVRVEGSSYRRTGARMLVSENGSFLEESVVVAWKEMP
jgi:hypothetical protein